MGILQRRGNAGPTEAVVDTFYSDALRILPSITVWAAAANAEFRAVARNAGDPPIRGVLHHDGALLRFTTWGQIERFIRSPMEFSWAADEGTLSIFGAAPVLLSGFEPLANLVDQPPAFAAQASGDDPLLGLTAWLESWS